jgi:hypothetical protein
MRTLRRIWLAGRLVGLLFVSVGIVATASFAGQQTPTSQEVPIVKGGAGACSADFVVHDPSGKGIYDAKITIEIKYGFMGLRKLDLTIGTNWDGKARVEGMPERIKGTAEFKISHGDQYRLIPYDPLASCRSSHEVVLGDKQGQAANSSRQFASLD